MSNPKGKFLAKYKTTLLSTGVPSFDTLINGGLAVGTLTLFEEDNENIHSSMLCKHIISYCMANGQDAAIVLDSISPESFLERLPKIITNKTVAQTHAAQSADLEIAWRYKNLRVMDNSFAEGVDDKETAAEGSDLLKICSHIVDKEKLSQNVTAVLQFIENFIKTKGAMRKPLRVIISSFSSPLWGSFASKKDFTYQISRFLFCLKKIIHGSFTSVVITVNPQQLEEIKLLIHSFSDYIFKFNAFTDPKSVTDKLYNDVTGLMIPVKIPSINSLEPIYKPNTMLWSYHILRRRIMFKEFSLPPCLSDNTSRTNQSNPSKTINMKTGCGVDF